MDIVSFLIGKCDNRINDLKGYVNEYESYLKDIENGIKCCFDKEEVLEILKSSYKEMFEVLENKNYLVDSMDKSIEYVCLRVKIVIEYFEEINEMYWSDK